MERIQTIYSNSTVRVAAWFGIIILVLASVTFILQPLLLPLLVSFSLYALFEPFNAYLLRRHVSEKLAATLVVLTICVLFTLFFMVLATPVKQQFQLLIERFPVILDSLSNSLLFLGEQLNLSLDKTSLLNVVSNSQQQVGELAITHGSTAMLSVMSLMVLVPLITFFLLKDYRGFRSWILSALPNASFELGWIIYYRVVEKLQHYIRGIMIQSFVVAVVCSAGFYLVGFESFILLGVLAGILNIIPYIGPLLAMVLPSLLVLSEIPFDGVSLVLSIAVILTAQIIDNLFVIPMVIANSVNLHPMVVIIGLVIFGSFFGVIGMVLAVPVLVTINIIYTGLKSGLYVKQ